MAAELNYLVVEAQTTQELEKKVNDRIGFGYLITPTPLAIVTDSSGTRYFQTMIKAK